MPSLFDIPSFSSSVFLARRNEVPPPPLARDFFVAVAPGVRLQVRLHERPGTIATVLLFHGNGEYAASYDALAGHFQQAGARLAVAEFRGYGLSTGTPTLRDCVGDAPAVLAAVRGEVGDAPLVVMGRSLGNLCAAELCRHEGAGVNGFIFESAPADIHATLRRWGIRLDHPLPEEDLATFCPLRKLRRCGVPTLVLHGESDTLIPATEARLTFDALPTQEKELVILWGAGHNNISSYPAYWEAVARLVTRAVGATTR